MATTAVIVQGPGIRTSGTMAKPGRCPEVEKSSKGMVEHGDQMIVEICPSDWRKICYHRVRGVLLKVASEGDIDDVWGFIYDLSELLLKKKRWNSKWCL